METIIYDMRSPRFINHSCHEVEKSNNPQLHVSLRVNELHM
jgi:hypothetical protein